MPDPQNRQSPVDMVIRPMSPSPWRSDASEEARGHDRNLTGVFCEPFCAGPSDAYAPGSDPPDQSRRQRGLASGSWHEPLARRGPTVGPSREPSLGSLKAVRLLRLPLFYPNPPNAVKHNLVSSAYGIKRLTGSPPKAISRACVEHRRCSGETDGIRARRTSPATMRRPRPFASSTSIALAMLIRRPQGFRLSTPSTWRGWA